MFVLVVEDPSAAGDGGGDVFVVCGGHGCAQICVSVASGGRLDSERVRGARGEKGKNLWRKVGPAAKGRDGLWGLLHSRPGRGSAASSKDWSLRTAERARLLLCLQVTGHLGRREPPRLARRPGRDRGGAGRGSRDSSGPRDSRRGRGRGRLRRRVCQQSPRLWRPDP